MRRLFRWGWWCVFAIVSIARITYLPLIDPDEAHYAEITREMRQMGDYLVPRIDGVPVIDKPALFHWIQAGTMAAFDDAEFGARLPTAAASLLLLLATYWTGRRLFDAATGERAALMLAFTPLTFALANVAIFDSIFNAFLFTAFGLLAVSALEGRRWLQIPAFILLSGAIQIKGPFVLIVLPAAAVVACVSKETRALLRRIDWVPGLAASVVLALPWFVLMWRRFGQQFINDYVLYNNVQLFGAALYRKSFYPFFYFRSGGLSLFPWSIMLVGVAIDLVRHWRAGERLTPARVLLWSWTAVIFGFFSASRFKLDHYIFPLAPAVCLLVSDAWSRASTGAGRAGAGHTADTPAPVRRYAATVIAMGVAAVLVTVIGAVGVVMSLASTRGAGLPWYGALLFAAMAVGGAVWVWQMVSARRPSSRAFVSVMAALVALYTAVMVVGFPFFDATRPGHDLGVWLKDNVQADDAIIIYNQGRWKASLRFYAEHPVEQSTESAELLAAWRRPQRVYAVLVPEDLDVLTDADLPYDVVHSERTVVGNEGRFLRRLVWGDVLVVTNRP